MRTLILLAFILAGTAHAQQLRLTQEVSQVLVAVVWAADLREVRRLADEADACPNRRDVCNGFAQLLQLDGGIWVCRITAVRPRAWSDDTAIHNVGHEAMHCLGFDH